jgi:hypothetical protein
MKEWDPSKPMTEDMEGLMRLKYECDDPTGIQDIFLTAVTFVI